MLCADSTLYVGVYTLYPAELIKSVTVFSASVYEKTS